MALAIDHRYSHYEDKMAMWLFVAKDGETEGEKALELTEFETKRTYQALLQEETKNERARDIWKFEASETCKQLINKSAKMVDKNRILFNGAKPMFGCVVCDYHTRDQGKSTAVHAIKSHYRTSSEQEQNKDLWEKMHPSEAWLIQADAQLDREKELEERREKKERKEEKNKRGRSGGSSGSSRSRRGRKGPRWEAQRW